MLDVIKTYTYNELVITVVQTPDREYASTCFEADQIDREDALPTAPMYFIVSSGKADWPVANGVTVYTSKKEALNAAEDEHRLWLTWAREGGSMLLEQDSL